MSFHVSVVMPVFNAEAFLRRAVESAVQLQQVKEVILVNDFGPDRSWDLSIELAKEFSKIRLIEHPEKENKGPGASRNLGIQKSQCDFIAFLDADDWYLPHRFDADQQILESDSTVDGVYNAVGNFYETEALRELWFSQGFPDLITLSAPVPAKELPLVLLHRHRVVRGDFQTNAITVRKQLFQKTGLFHTQLRLRQDTHMWHRLSVAGKLMAGNLATPVAIHRVHAHNRMTKTEDHQLYLDLWFHSLWTELRRLKASTAVMNALRLAWCLHEKQKGREWSALGKLLRWTMSARAEVLKPYGEFDWLFRRLMGDSRLVNRMLSAKNRIASVMSASATTQRIDSE